MTQAESNVFAVSVMFRDQVGIVASVSAAMQKLGGNLHDVTQTVLQGYFSMLLLADMPKTVSKEEIIKALEALPELKGACFGVLPYDGPLEQSVDAVNTYVLTASGADKPGLVATVSRYLKEHGVNIVDLSSRYHDGDYTMIWQLQLPPGLDAKALQDSMQNDMKDDLEIGIRHEELFTVTNEI